MCYLTICRMTLDSGPLEIRKGKGSLELVGDTGGCPV